MSKILVTEDERDIRELIAFTLRFAGYEVVTAENGEEGVLMAAQEKPDMILMDIRMPKLTGYEACARIKADPLLADIPVVFLSAKGQEAEIRVGLDAGASEYLLKPFGPMELVERVKELMVKFGKA
jgi:DNA-binding response OmpR family regulator